MRLNGGEFLLDLTALSLTDSASSVTISNTDVLSQLTDLKTYIRNQKAIKPVWIKFFDDDSDEIVVARGEIRKLLDDLEFDLFISSKGRTLSIHVEFTQMVDANSNPLDDYYIASGDASYVFTSEQPIFEEIVDKDGHQRFIDGDIDPTLPAGLTLQYGKWSLSGSHLMIVIALAVASSTTTNVMHIVFDNLPEWIEDKIVPVFGDYIEDKGKVSIVNTSTQKVGEFNNNLNVNTDGHLRITYAIGTATIGDGFVRVVYDLLIDNE